MRRWKKDARIIGNRCIHHDVMLRVRKKKRTYGFLRAHHLEATRGSLFIATAEWLTSYCCAALAPDTTPCQSTPSITSPPILQGSCPAPSHYQTFFNNVFKRAYVVLLRGEFHSPSTLFFRLSFLPVSCRDATINGMQSLLPPNPRKYQPVQMTTFFRFPIPIVHHVMAPSWSRYGTIAYLTPG